MITRADQTRQQMSVINTMNGSGPSAAPSSTQQVASSSTVTMTTTTTTTTGSTDNNTILQLTLASRPSVRWDESTIDNEGMGRKSSKRCCIFHKQRKFDESSTDSSDQDGDVNSDGKKIARPKKGTKVPDYQRFHA